ncbi:MAG: Crp/Fnr family transcriptional regulator [Lachnospirales bacterium]
MTFDEVLQNYPILNKYTCNAPQFIKDNFFIKKYPPKSIIHQKHDVIDYFGIVLDGTHRVVNEFENGNIFLIEKNKAISFIGEVTLLAERKESSVTIESITKCTIFYISSHHFKKWIQQDANFLCLLSGSIANKLYSSSYSRGERQYYSVSYIVMKYLVDETKNGIQKGKYEVIIKKTRQEICEEVGLTVKTFNRTIANLREKELVNIVKGKISISPINYKDLQIAISKHHGSVRPT